MGGEYPKSLEDIFGFPYSSTNRVIDLFLNAVRECDDPRMAVKLPVTPEDLAATTDYWKKISSAGDLFHGLLLCIDGWLCCTQYPSDVDNPGDHFSGHYQCHGLNVQAACDAHLRFWYLSTIAPGKTNNCCAFNRCLMLRKWLSSLPGIYFMGGYNAYTCTRKLLIPYGNAEILGCVHNSPRTHFI